VKDWEDARRHLDQALWGLHPDAVGLFGGAIVPSTLHFPFSHLPAGDLRDWGEIEAWARRLPETLGLGVPV
jgi:hypothetical protein